MSKHYQLPLPQGDYYPYQVISSKRARYIRIKLNNNGDLSVVLPQRVNIRHAHDFLLSKAHWVEKNLSTYVKKNRNQRPEIVNLKLLGEIWEIEYGSSEQNTAFLIEKGAGKLLIGGNNADFEQINALINQWCRQRATQVLPQLVADLAASHGFTYNKVSIRTQKTRWGSCSNRKNISLNSKLLFFPKKIVEYVILHELSHTVEMNHSHRFWKLVEKCQPDYQIQRDRLKKLAKDIHF